MTFAKQFAYGHKWRQGDAILWDNRSAMHCATPYDEINHRRIMYRTTIMDGVRVHPHDTDVGNARAECQWRIYRHGAGRSVTRSGPCDIGVRCLLRPGNRHETAEPAAQGCLHLDFAGGRWGAGVCCRT